MALLTLPFTLFREDQPSGKIVTYDYEIPWATGQARADNEDELRILVEACEFSAESQQWPETLTDYEAEERWQTTVQQRRVISATLSTCHHNILHRFLPTMLMQFEKVPD